MCLAIWLTRPLKPHLNGQLADVHSYNEQSGRWQVALLSAEGERLALKAENLVREAKVYTAVD